MDEKINSGTNDTAYNLPKYSVPLPQAEIKKPNIAYSKAKFYICNSSIMSI